ncbi:ROK family protein [Jiella sp. M17.18]|uniref:ROK family transcriptional regulator n=1 Tax=Jiella sp. M17.18 TaxID=3234247 RepID=UPI0034DE81F5
MAASFTASAIAVFARLRAAGPATRPQLCEALGLSKPTMSLAIAELEESGYVSKIGMAQGDLGRRANVYRLATGAGHVAAIDAGSTAIRIELRTLDARMLYEASHALTDSQRHLNEAMGSVIRQALTQARDKTVAEWGPLRAIGVAVPSRVHPDPGRQRDAPGLRDLFTQLPDLGDVPIVVENNVNCAAMAEHAIGVAQGHDDFIFLQIGVKLGMGLVIGGQLIRGRSGGAGEISELPFPWLPGEAVSREALENYISANALMERVADNWPPDEPLPENPGALFALSETGHSAALAHVRRHSEDVARIAAACISVLDPEILVLGGGVGGNPVLQEHVKRTLAKMGCGTPVAASALKLDATLRGIGLIVTSQVERTLMTGAA